MTNKDEIIKSLEGRIENYKKLSVEDFAEKFCLIPGTNAYNFGLYTGKWVGWDCLATPSENEDRFIEWLKRDKDND